MVRTTLSFCALFGCLLGGFALMQRSQSASSSPKATHLQSSKSDAPATIEPHVASRAAEKSAQSEPARLLLMATEAKRSVATNSARGASGPQTEIQFVAYEENVSDEPFGEEYSPTEPPKSEDKTNNSAEGDGKPDEPKALPEREKELSPELIELRERLRDCLAHYHQNPENVALRSPWGAMHAMIAYGVDTELIAQNRKVNAIGYLCYNGNCNGQTLFWVQGNKLQTKIGPGVQGHAGQFLAMLAQSRVRSEYPIKVDGHDFTVADLIEHEKYTCQPRTELTFKLIALTHYLKSDEKWKSFDGQEWDIPKLIKEELAQPIIGAACGGTHRLTGFSYAVHKREKRKEPIEGQWLRAKKFIDDYHDYTFKLQNPDGSFSTNWFAGREDNGPPSRRLETTGHTTEWLAYSLPEEQLEDERMVKAVKYLTDLLLDGRNEKWSIGPLGHGLHALAIYDERVFGGQPGKRSEQLARQVKPLVRRK